MMKYEFKNEMTSASLKIYDYIGSDGWDEGVTAQSIEDHLKSINNVPLNIYINSGGGDVFEGFAIYNMLKRYEGNKTVYIDGIAASIASVIAMCGDKIVMNTASMMMIHNASGMCIGNAEEMQKVVNALEQINDVIRDVYQTRCNLSEDKLKELMDNETFMTAKECVEYGFADEIAEDSKDTIKNANETLDEMVATMQKKVKQYKDLQKLGFEAQTQVGGNPVDDEEGALNNTSHKWDWLKMEG